MGKAVALGTVPLWWLMKLDRVSADELLRRLYVTAPPVPIEELARKLEIVLHKVHNPGWAGACQSTREQADIWVNADDIEVRQRFTIAHEIGHLILHPLGEVFRDTTFEGNPREAQANGYAAGLLMPYSMLAPLARAHDYDASRLAEVFQVSKRAMEIRLLTLMGVGR
jgi:Zn-dependent peptidase ImmA (M78 family)